MKQKIFKNFIGILGLGVISLLTLGLGTRFLFPSGEIRSWLMQEFSIRMSTSMEDFSFNPWPFYVGFKKLEVQRVTPLEKLPQTVWDVPNKKIKPPVKVSIDSLQVNVPIVTLLKNGNTMDKLNGAQIDADWFGGSLSATAERVVGKSTIIKASFDSIQLTPFAAFLPESLTLEGDVSGVGSCNFPDDRKESAMSGSLNLKFRQVRSKPLKLDLIEIPSITIGDFNLGFKHTVDTKWTLEPVQISSKDVVISAKGEIDVDRKQFVSSLLKIDISVSLTTAFLDANPKLNEYLSKIYKDRPIELKFSLTGSIRNPITVRRSKSFQIK